MLELDKVKRGTPFGREKEVKLNHERVRQFWKVQGREVIYNKKGELSVCVEKFLGM